MTKTRRFLVLALCLISLASGLAMTWAFTSLREYRTLADNTETRYFMDLLEDFTLQTASRLEPDFAYAAGNDVDENALRQIQNTMLDNTAAGYDALSRDPNFHYSVKSKDAELHSEDPVRQEDSYTMTFRFEDGKLKGSGSLLNYGFDPLQASSLRTSLAQALEYGTYDETTGEFVNRDFTLPENLTFRFPEDITFTYSIPKEPAVTTSGTYIYNLLVSREMVSVAVIMILILTLVLECIVLFRVPLELEEHMALFGAISRGSLEGNLILLGFSGAVAVLGFVLSTSMAQEGVLTSLAIAGGAKTGLVFSGVVLCTIFTACMLYASLPLFWIRQILTIGPVRYFRSHCKLADWMKRSADVMANDVLSRRLSLPVVVNLIAVALIILTGSRFLAVVYGLFLAATMFFVSRSVHRGWSTITNEADRLAAGDFQSDPEGDPTVFAPIHERLKQVRRGFRRALEEQVESTNMRNELISNVSHDLKTPLTGLRSYSELLEITSDPEKMRKYAAKIGQYTDRLNSLVTDLFDVSKANAGSLPLEPISLHLDQLILQALEEADADWKAKSLEAVTELTDAPVFLDPDKTMRIFENLFSNISKYALAGTRVFIDLQETPSCYVARIRNVSAAPLNFSAEEITERFVRGDKSRHEVGSGLGLAIVKSFTEVQQGHFSIEIDGDLFRAIVVLPKSENLPPVPDAQTDGKNESV